MDILTLAEIGEVNLQKEAIDKTKIEKRAIHFLETPIVECDYLDSSINSMDKELSWDGYIYTFMAKHLEIAHLMIKFRFKLRGIGMIKRRKLTKEYPVSSGFRCIGELL